MREEDQEHLRFLLDVARKHQASASWERPQTASKYLQFLEMVQGDILDMLDLIVEDMAPEPEQRKAGGDA